MNHKIQGLPPAMPRAVETGAAVPARSPAGGDRSQAVDASPAADSMRLTGEAAGLQALQRELGSAPAGVDVEKVEQVRAALADGSYRVDAQQVADRLLAFESALLK
ncbi:flagellar biosynthesis anti-sigma factor FlgM [Lysobacter sp. GX 14042]|uniref:flagellar biosynthesis anti-sigma factor FlgM n=1 Tax=Lysobacter sp. GX 14042 TaxID=2907155 RepID=UPI001F3A6B6C|nr:flagellar biosynthesis anti-sigma factor FlgM [Lysobacter sp. GX 14042]MCE7031949.1 flagellar biosynthesis anti-sigma factor FlgM [Lysobacter sp. GX 14042]